MNMHVLLHVYRAPPPPVSPDISFCTLPHLLLTQKFRINLLDVSTGPSFHRCVYFLAAKDPAIMAAGQAARDTFGMTGDDYMPHCSLLYADLAPEDKGRAAAAAVQRLFGEGSDYSTLLLEAGFTAESITLWYTPADDLQLASWKQLAEFELQ